jgi:hypothetical protein
MGVGNEATALPCCMRMDRDRGHMQQHFSLVSLGIFSHLFLFFAKIYGLQEICKTIHLPPWGTAATAVGHGGRGPVCFQKFVVFCLNSDGCKLYMKL